MSVESSLSSRTLALRINGVFSATERGHLAQELVRTHRTLKSNKNPKTQFAMSEDQEQACRARREELCGLLGLPPDEGIREKKIQGFDGKLRQVGLPYYRIHIK